ncbi:MULTISPECIES: PspC domain-containing protein [unclassified Cryobacterium]|uniref:ATP-binding protein n=1 Tax=unclassified Cryobacterium TaxID=2649013 RepID=UPI002AB543D3|nr:MULTISPECIES: PspC domain-containing protein [unclassified Cryobacterium]MDY7541710.1 PspC domain-containing protein [Cryobacterium sp. 5B3]MEA9999621.1 PspC domain-containing protein [Cryobacterium sp. RTS3]MEB0266441.1 PspC domain-containing protein [Cryobacterium sp. 10I5]MEB0275436.1 PspC domain-containing protein [Cryobacterium sp. 5B3]
MRTERMTRPRQRIIAGVCAGFAEHTGLSVTVVRSATLLLVLAGGAGALLYAWLWVTTPTESANPARFGTGELPKASLARPAPGYAGSSGSGHGFGPGEPADAAAERAAAAASSARSAPITEILLGLALLAAGLTLVASRLGADIPLAVVIPAIVVLSGTALAWRQFADIRGGSEQHSSALLVRALGALVLVAVGILLFFVTSDSPDGWTVVIASASVLLGVVVVIAPWLVRLSRDLADERAGRAREAERAEIAAHLHDSVLQTLALIQQKAGPQSDAARLARAQERELREWLFTGTGTGFGTVADAGAGGSGTGAGAEGVPDVDLPTALRRIAAELEADFPVQFDIVSAGASLGPAPEGLLAAGREAMLNAARHSGGPVSVYLETGANAVSLSVTDRGPGFRLEDVPDDRHGVRESVIGRMRRLGGTALVRPGPGGAGTEILLTLPTASAAPDLTNSTDFLMKTHVTGPIRVENATISVELVREEPVQPDEADVDGSR